MSPHGPRRILPMRKQVQDFLQECGQGQLLSATKSSTVNMHKAKSLIQTRNLNPHPKYQLVKTRFF